MILERQKQYDVIAIRKARRAIVLVILLHIIRELGKTNQHQISLLVRKLDLPIGSIYLKLQILSFEKWGYITIGEGRTGKVKWITLTEKGLLSYRSNIEGFEKMLAVGDLLKMKKNELLKL